MARHTAMGLRDVHVADTTDNNAWYCFKAGEYVHAEWLQMHIVRKHSKPFSMCTECNKKGFKPRKQWPTSVISTMAMAIP